MKEYKLVVGSIADQSIGFFGLGGTKSGPDAFVEEVNEHLALGWECQGGVCTMVTDKGRGVGGFLQALVRDVSE